MVGATGFEPATPCAQGRCATRLRYAPTREILQNITLRLDDPHAPVIAGAFACLLYTLSIGATNPELRQERADVRLAAL